MEACGGLWRFESNACYSLILQLNSATAKTRQTLADSRSASLLTRPKAAGISFSWLDLEWTMVHPAQGHDAWLNSSSALSVLRPQTASFH